VAIHRKYKETKWVDPENGSLLRPKLREAPQKVLRDFCLLPTLAFGKQADKATRLFRFVGFFQWKADKSSNKHPLK
jgi:hypothetical protein